MKTENVEMSNNEKEELERKENLGNETIGSATTSKSSRFKFRFRKENSSSPLHPNDPKKTHSHYKKGLKRFMNRGGSNIDDGHCRQDNNNDNNNNNDNSNDNDTPPREALGDIRVPIESNNNHFMVNRTNDRSMETNTTDNEIETISKEANDYDSQKKRRVDDHVIQHQHDSPPSSSSSPPPHEFDVPSCSAASSVPFSPDAMEADAFQSLYYYNHDKDHDSDEDHYHDAKITYSLHHENDMDDVNNDKDENDDNGTDDNDDDDDDDISCASTVVMDDRPPRCIRPPPTSSKEEQARFYWEWCYGTNSPFPNNDDHSRNTFAATTASTEMQPLKSCLSAKKTPWTEIAKSASKRNELRQATFGQMTPEESAVPTQWNTLDVDPFDKKNDMNNNTTTTTNNNNNNNSHSMTQIHTTPKMTTPQTTTYVTSSKKKVQFGSASAAEFKSSRPTVELTPLTKDQAMKEFPLDKEIIEEEEEEHQETAMNGAILAAWDDVFDDYANDDFDDGDSIMLMSDDDDDGVEDDGDENENSAMHRRALVTHSGSRRKSTKGRRSSSFFQREIDGSLLPNSLGVSSDDNDFNMDSESLVDPGHPSPLKRDSLLFSSPSELGDSWRLSTSDSEGSRITPITDVTSSSSVLRSLHSSGGAHLGHNTDELHRKDLQPNQLDLKLQQAEACEMMDCANNNFDINCVKATDTFHSNYLHFVLRSSLIDVIHEHELNVSIFATDTGMNVDEKRLSLLGMKRDVDEATQNQTSWFPYQDYTVDLLGNVIDILEDQNLIDNHNVRDFTSKLKLLQNHPRKYRDELYEFCARSAITKWLSCEEEALRSSLAWLADPLSQMYSSEESELNNLLTGMESLSLTENTGMSRKNIQSQIDAELNIVEQLQQCVDSEERMLQQTRLQAEYLESRCELEYNRLYVDDCNYKVLQSILPYFCHFEDDLTIVYPHFHNDINNTIVKWRPHNGKNGESIESKQDSSPISHYTEPTITLTHCQKSNMEIQLPQGSSALDLYSKILTSDVLKGFIGNQFKVEDELAVLTSADIFGAIDCLTLDVFHLESKDDSTVEVIEINSNAFDILLSLRLDECHSVNLRCSYFLTEERTLLNFLPNHVSVSTNLPNGSWEHLSTYISKYISTASRNTFLLSSICSHVRTESFR